VRGRVAYRLREPGEVLAAEAGVLRVACGEGALEIERVQRPGGRRQPVREWLAGCDIRPGERLG